MPLTDVAIRNAKPKEKPYKITHEKGMYVLVNRKGKYFRLDYRFNGKRKTLALGVYPYTTLAKANELLLVAKTHLANGLDPGKLKKLQKREDKIRARNTFKQIALRFITQKANTTWSPSHKQKVLGRFEKDVFPVLGHRPIAEITASELLDILQRIQDRGAIDTAHRVKQSCSQVFRHAINKEKVLDRNPIADLQGALPSINKKNFATITEPKKIGELLRAIEGYSGSHVSRYALQFAPLVFVRPGELRHAEWSEIDFERAEWRIPAHKMKMKIEHLVPLSSQVLKLLTELYNYTGDGKYLFPSVRTNSRPMSENTVNAALRRLGYTKDEFTGHGFRAMASTSLHEQGWKSEIIELQLSHKIANEVKAAYCHATYLPERRKMMQAWADYLDGLKAGETSRYEQAVD